MADPDMVLDTVERVQILTLADIVHSRRDQRDISDNVGLKGDPLIYQAHNESSCGFGKGTATGNGYLYLRGMTRPGQGFAPGYPNSQHDRSALGTGYGSGLSAGEGSREGGSWTDPTRTLRNR